MKTVFTILLSVFIHSLLFFSCEDPSLEGFVADESTDIAALPPPEPPFIEEPKQIGCVTFSERQPEFPGGLKALFEFLASNNRLASN